MSTLPYPALGFLANILNFYNFYSDTILLIVSTVPFTDKKMEIIVHKLINPTLIALSPIFSQLPHLYIVLTEYFP